MAMYTELTVDISQQQTGYREVEELLQSVRDSHPQAQVSIQEPKGAFPADPDTIIIGVNASLNLISLLYPKLKEELRTIGDGVSLLNPDGVARNYLIEEVNCDEDALEVQSRSAMGDIVEFEFVDKSDGSEHKIRVDQEDVSNIEYSQM